MSGYTPNEQNQIIIDLDPEVLEKDRPIIINGLSPDQDGTMVIINVDTAGHNPYSVKSQVKVVYTDGTGHDTERPNHETEIFDDNHLLWNFYDSSADDGLYAGTISIDAPFQGSLLAPKAEVIVNQNLDGNIVADKVTVKAESHRWDLQDNSNVETDYELPMILPGEIPNTWEPGEPTDPDTDTDEGDGEDNNGGTDEGDGDENVDPDTDTDEGDGEDNNGGTDEGDGDENTDPDVDIDTDGDGDPDINIDTDGDGDPDINIDTDGDGEPDINIDTDGDGDGDGEEDVDTDTNTNPEEPGDENTAGEGDTDSNGNTIDEEDNLLSGNHNNNNNNTNSNANNNGLLTNTTNTTTGNKLPQTGEKSGLLTSIVGLFLVAFTAIVKFVKPNKATK